MNNSIPLVVLLVSLAGRAVAGETAPASLDNPTGAFAAQQRLLLQCRRPAFDIEALLANPVERADLGYASDQTVQALIEFVACRGLTSLPPGCDGLSGVLPRHKRAAAECGNYQGQARLVHALHRGGDAQGACRGLFASDGTQGPSVDKACEALIAAVRRGPAACEGVTTPISARECREQAAIWSGQAKGCANIGTEGGKRQCSVVATAALAATGRAPCAESWMCAASAGGTPDACAAPRARFKSSLCERVKGEIDLEIKRLAAADAARLSVQQKAEAEAKKQADIRAKGRKASRIQFVEGQPMQSVPDEVKEQMKALEAGRPYTPKKAEKSDKGEGAER